ncbi:hypothetical protein [Pseudomonas xantholysinigenes]|uniref:Uncharacterized protein n=1 Tax=Pseudomonas xantholysinigenes TaxID=2745490 RepID=A0A9E6TWH3_9PSED|nr:hypothetical protein [Pseudomonas xantholysinigenes]QXI37522.1 hypothetical protein HU772_019615 [Pseudomonas xantholysinigenes]HCT7915536.1 hypothetical protein [Pseudomonas aeruginosa]
MSEKAKRVLSVWVSLTPEEREEAVKLINEYQNADERKKKEISLESLNESHWFAKSTTMNFGPLGGECPYCGK